MSFFKRRTILIVIVLFFVSIQLFSLNLNQNGAQNPVARIILLVTYYPQKFINASTDKVIHAWQNYFDLVKLKQQNKKLRTEIEQLRKEKYELSEYKLQNVRLKKLLEFSARTEYPVVSANVIGASPSILRSQVVIVDKGLGDGIQEGMPVASTKGIVGRVLVAGDKSSEILLITDPVSAVDAYIHRTRARGIVKGVGTKCVMEYIEKKSDVSVGDKVISSGKDGFFPKGVLIGTVTDINPRGTFITAEIEPYVDLSSLEEVVIILKGVNVVLNE